jgi:rhodanese-related sulfurtransferase
MVPADVAGRVGAGATVVDVRSTPEWKTGHLANSMHAPLGRLVAAMADKARSSPLILLCESGSRSAIGASLLAASGFTDVANLDGGITAWRRDGLPVEVDTVVFASST